MMTQVLLPCRLMYPNTRITMRREGERAFVSLTYPCPRCSREVAIDYEAQDGAEPTFIIPRCLCTKGRKDRIGSKLRKILEGRVNAPSEWIDHTVGDLLRAAEVYENPLPRHGWDPVYAAPSEWIDHIVADLQRAAEVFENPPSPGSR